MPSVLAANLERVRERIASACASAARPPSEVTLLAVTKSVPPAAAAQLARLGQSDLGENRVDGLDRKADLLRAAGLDVRWHFIGHLQRNKARRAAARAHVIHSVDTPRLLDALERLAGELERELDVYLQVKLVDTDGRSGFQPEELPDAARFAAASAHLRLVGLMAMAAPDPGARPGDLASQERARRTFAGVRALARRLPQEAFVGGRCRLSMGMSADLEAAIHEGADVVRIGTALFEGLPAEEPTP